MANEIKVTTIPATGYYSCGTYTDSNGNTFSHLQWYGEELPDNYDGSGNLWFFKEGEEELAETIIIYDPEIPANRPEKEMEYFEETYLDIEDEQVFDSLMDDLQDGLFDSEQGEEAGEYNWQAAVRAFDLLGIDPYVPVLGNQDRPHPEPSEIELETLRSVRNRLFKLYNHVDENTEYDDYSLGLKAAVIEIDKMIENNGKK